MDKFAKYFGSYLTGLAAIVALFPMILTNFSEFPFPEGNFVKIFGYMCTVSNYLIITMAVFYKSALERAFFLPTDTSRMERIVSWVIKSLPAFIFIGFLLSCVIYIVGNRKFRSEIFVADGFTMSFANILYVALLAFIFIAPIFALVLTGMKDVLEKERSERGAGSE